MGWGKCLASAGGSRYCHLLFGWLAGMSEMRAPVALLLPFFSRSVVSDSATPRTAAHQASLSFTTSWSLLKLMSAELVMPSNHLTLCHSLPLLPSVFPSIGVFSNELALCIRWPKCWCFRFSISPSSDYSGLISLQSPRDSHESSPTPQFKSINSSVLSFLYGPALTSIHNYWKNHSFD